MAENSGCCSNSNCGCRLDVWQTSRKCPNCGKSLCPTGRSRLLELKLNCNHCGYYSPILSQEELHELI